MTDTLPKPPEFRVDFALIVFVILAVFVVGYVTATNIKRIAASHIATPEPRQSDPTPVSPGGNDQHNVAEPPKEARELPIAPGFVRVQLDRGVSATLPKTWIALSGKTRTTLADYVESKQGLAGIEPQESSLSFAANYYDDSGKVAAIFNIRHYTEITLDQSFVKKLGQDDMKDIDEEIHKQALAGFQLFDGKDFEWQGTSRQTIGGLTALVSEYRRTGSTPGTKFCARMVKVLNGPRSFTVTISLREDMERILRPICDQVMLSIRQGSD